MSSPPSEPPADERPRATSGWAPWRRTMLAGALVLLATSLSEALMDPDPPEAIKLTGWIAGYLLLAFGFGLRMRNR